MKRICLFSGYNYGNKISQYVVDYIRELSDYSDVYYMADGELDDKTTACLKPYVKKAWGRAHGKYDFGSYSELANKYVGWGEIDKYDELILANDSCFCVNSFSSVFEKMDEKKDLDLWGLLATDEQNCYGRFSLEDYLKMPSRRIPMFCVGSYFLGIRKSLFSEEYFKEFLNSVEVKNSRYEICLTYEMGLTALAKRHGKRISCFDETVYNNSTLYAKEAFNLLKNGFPLLKVRIFIDNIGGIRENVDDLALITNDFVSCKYLHYINDVRLERNIEKKKKCIKKQWKEIYKRCEDYVVPDIIHDLFRVPQRIIKKYKRNRLARKLEKIKNSKEKKRKSKHEVIYDKAELKNANHRNLVIFFNVISDSVSGGMLSIDRFVTQSIQMAQGKKFDLLYSMLPFGERIEKNRFFDYAIPPVEFFDIVDHCEYPSVILNIPEICVPYFVEYLTPRAFFWLYSRKRLHINILNQNDSLMPASHYIEELRKLTNNHLSITAAHKKYANNDKAIQYDTPVYLLTPFLPKFYRKSFSEKENIIVLSKDILPHGLNVTNSQVIEAIHENLPEYEVRIVENMTFEEYKKLISRAKYAITFGEGYDGYFVEPYLSDSVAFAVYNEVFFPADFKNVPTVYSSWDELMEKVIKDIRYYDSSCEEYARISNQVERLIRKYTNDDLSKKNLADFYDIVLPSDDVWHQNSSH